MTSYTGWAFEQGRRLKLKTGERMLLLELAFKANGAPSVRMTDSEAAAEFVLFIGAVRRAIAGLEAAGVIRVERHQGRASAFHLLNGYPPQDAGDQS